ncbi:MAG: hypothetical protein IJJ44_00930 [Solobacterium sp.]|nr:hypothetical protein [Solobacterium sp.]
MGRKRHKKQIKPEIEKEVDYYDLKKGAIQDLVEADESNSPEVSEEELQKYRGRQKFKMAPWLVALLIKFWFAGAVCFFFIWGLGLYLADVLDTLVVTAIAMGMVTDLLTNNILRFFAKTEGENDRWIMVTKRGYISFVLNILYAALVVLCVYSLYAMINSAFAAALNQPDRVVLGVEPILFGLFYLGFDLLFIYFKHHISNILTRSKVSTQ